MRQLRWIAASSLSVRSCNPIHSFANLFLFFLFVSIRRLPSTITGREAVAATNAHICIPPQCSKTGMRGYWVSKQATDPTPQPSPIPGCLFFLRCFCPQLCESQSWVGGGLSLCLFSFPTALSFVGCARHDCSPKQRKPHGHRPQLRITAAPALSVPVLHISVLSFLFLCVAGCVRLDVRIWEGQQRGEERAFDASTLLPRLTWVWFWCGIGAVLVR